MSDGGRLRWALRYPRSWLRWKRSDLRSWLDSGPWVKVGPKYNARCVMGYPQGFQCRRAAIDTTLWCPKHTPAAPTEETPQ